MKKKEMRKKREEKETRLEIKSEKKRERERKEEKAEKLDSEISSLSSTEKFKIANSRKVKPKVLEILSKDKDPSVRLAVAKNRKTPIEVLENLSNDKVEAIRHSARETLKKKEKKASVALTQRHQEKGAKHNKINDSISVYLSKLITKDREIDNQPIFEFIHKNSRLNWKEVDAEDCVFTEKVVGKNRSKFEKEIEKLIKELEKNFSDLTFSQTSYYKWVEIRWSKKK